MRISVKKMMMLLLVLPVLFAGSDVKAQVTVDVDVNLNVKHSVDTVSEFDRKKYINLHANLTDKGWDSDAMRDQFLGDYDVYLGRDNGSMPWRINQLDEDPNKEGWPSPIDMTNRGNTDKNAYAAKTSVHRHEHRSDMMIGGQPVMYPNGDPTNPCCGNAIPWIMEGHESLAEFMANTLTKYYGSGGSTGEPRPTFMEVMNEPFVHADDIPTSKENISELHNAVAKRVHELAPDVMVGGYTSAWPEFEAGDFNQWNDNWKLFIDIAGENMDFFSVHIYDNWNENPGSSTYRAGANSEAILDMIEHYSYLTLGEVKPFNISEYGNFTRDMNGTPYTKERDWFNLRSFSSLMMGFLEKPDKMVKVMPFVLLKATWWTHESGNRYPHRLLRQEWELEGETGNDWVYTELVQFFQLWSDVKGSRIDTYPTDPDIQVDAYVDGNKAYVILNNLEFNDVDIKLNLFDDQNNTLEKVRIKHQHLDGSLPVLDSSSHTEMISRVTIGREATMILEYTFANEIILDQSSDEEKYYADKYLQAISTGEANVFVIDSVKKGDNGEATLRLGLGRDHGRSLLPLVLFNGDTLDVPRDIRGYNQLTRSRFFGILEIPVPYESLKEKNSVSVTFDDAGGHISSVSLQTFLQSKDLARTPAQSKFDAKFTVLEKTSEEAIEGAEVIFAGDTAYTDVLGVVVFDSVSQGSYPLHVQAQDFFSYSNPSYDHFTYTTSVISLDERTYELYFEVFEKMLQVPVYNATLKLADRSLLTNGEGMAGLDLTKGSYNYQISEDYFKTTSGTIDHTKDTLVRIDMERLLADVKFKIYSNEGSQRERDAVVELGDTSIISNSLGLATFKAIGVNQLQNYTVSKTGFSIYEGSFNMIQDTSIQVDLLLNTSLINSELEAIQIFPNPVEDMLSVRTGEAYSGALDIVLTDISGRVILSSQKNISGRETFFLDMSDFGPGVYMLKLSSGSQQTIKKLTIQ